MGCAFDWRREWGWGRPVLATGSPTSTASGLLEVDDFQVILERMTTPEQQPVLHFWRTQPDEARRMDEEQQLAFMLRYSQVMATALELVIANHLESQQHRTHQEHRPFPG